MSEHTPLTEAEREALWSWWNTPSTDPDADGGIDFDDLIPVIDRILAARTSTATADTGLRERVEAAIRLIQPDHLTPMGARQLRRALDATAAPTTDTGARRCSCGSAATSLTASERVIHRSDGPCYIAKTRPEGDAP